jgi:hypothetical protein
LDPFWARSMKSSFAWRYANACEGEFQFRLRQDNCTNGQQVTTYPDPYYVTEGSGEAYSFHPGGAFFAFGDGSVHFLNDDINIREFAKLISKKDGLQVIGVDY